MIDPNKAIVDMLIKIGETNPLPPQTEEEHRAEILRLFPPRYPWGKPVVPCAKVFYPDFKDFPEWVRDTFPGMMWTPYKDGYCTGVTFPRGNWRRFIESVADELAAAGFNATVYREQLSIDDVPAADRGRFCKTFLDTVERLRKEHKIRYRRKKRRYTRKTHTPMYKPRKPKRS